MPEEPEYRPGYKGPSIDWSSPPTWDAVQSALVAGRATAPSDDPVINEVRGLKLAQQNAGRRLGLKTGSATMGRGGAADIAFATTRPRDPMFYWKQNNIPYDVTQPNELQKVRELCRLLYQTHPVIASAIDIFSKYPLQGMELTCKDDDLTEFYHTLFIDQLGYEEFLIDIGREYWSCGEAWPFATFNELLGVWEDEELLRAEDITVIRSPFLREARFEMRLPEVLLQILNTREPRPEYERLVRDYPELVHFTSSQSRIPVSNVLLKQIHFKGDTFHPRGIPILLRAFRTIIQEEMLNSAQDAVADRLYTPLILAKLGASASDLGTQQPWIPTPGQLLDFEDALDAALAADFRVIVHNFAVSMESVFGRENMPDFTGDFERIDNRILQVFGLSKTMLSGADQGETYAADALNRDLVTQLLTTFQRKLQAHYEDRAYIVAEAQGHWDYDERGGQKYQIMEEVLEVDEETGEQKIVEKPKLLIPDLNFQAMNMQNDTVFRQLIEELRASNIPISMKTRLVNIPIDFEEQIEESKEEAIALAVAEQETRRETYKALKDAGLPIDEKLKADFEPSAALPPEAQAQAGAEGDPGLPDETIPKLGTDPITSMDALAPATFPTLSDDSSGGLRDGEGDASNGDSQDGAQPANVSRLPRNTLRQRYRPPESDEQRALMPKASALEDGSNGEGRRVRSGFQAPWSHGKRGLFADPDTPIGDNLPEHDAALFFDEPEMVHLTDDE